MAWSGGAPFQGEISCDRENVIIEADSATVNLQLTNSNCFTSGISPESGNGSTPNAFAGINPQFCEDDVSSYTTASCIYNPTAPPTQKRGMIGSYKIVVPAGRSLKNVSGLIAGEELSTGCYNAETNLLTAAPFTGVAAVNIPTLSASAPLPFKIRAYLGENCDSTPKGHITVGLNNPAESKFHQITGSQKNLFLRTAISGICSISDMMGTTDFAAGRGTSTIPYVICNNEQLKFLQTNMSSTPVRSGFYILGRDINLISGVQDDSGSSAVYDACLDFGDTFVPMGLYFDGSCNVLSYGTLFGGFDGNGNSIDHFRFRNEGAVATGFFTEINGYAANLILRKAKVQGKNVTGAIVGSANNGSNLYNLRVNESSIEGENNTGGVAGAVGTTASLQNIFGSQLDVEGDDDTGGLIGSTMSTLTNTAFQGRVYASNGSLRVGGIVGSTNSIINKAVSSGVIRGEATEIGGIVGNTTANIVYAGSGMLIQDLDYSTSGTRSFGGIAGIGTNIDRSYFSGFIRSSCTTSCGIGATAGDPATVSFIATLNPYSLGGTDLGTVYALPGFISATSVRDFMCTADGTCPWTQINDDFPRLDFETHPCSTSPNKGPLAIQLGLGRGSITRPMTICTEQQLRDVGTQTSTAYYYKILQNINFSQSASIASLKGNIDGGGHLIYGMTRVETNADAGIFGQILPGASLKNVTLGSFKIFDSATCPSCRMGTAAVSNMGTIANVEVRDAIVWADGDSSAEIGGLVSQNSGTIENVRVKDSSINGYKAGSIAHLNTGTIRYADSNSDILGPMTSGSYFVGGLVGSLAGGKLLKSRFEGTIEDHINNDSAGGVGGLVGKAYTFNGNVPLIEDCEVGKEALLLVNSTTTNFGGIMGNSINSTNIISRTIMQGFISEGTNLATANPDVGVGTWTNNSSYKLTSSYYILETPVSAAITFNSGTQICEVDITTAGQLSDPGVVFAGASIDWKYVTGPLVFNASNDFTLSLSISEKDCNDLNPAMTNSLYASWSPPDTVSISVLKLAGYDLVDFNVPAEKDRVFNSYLSFLTGNPVVNPPVWTFDDEEDGLGIFLLND